MIRKKKTWVAYCEGCHADYGQFDNKAEAEAHVNEFPLCFNCDGEHY